MPRFKIACSASAGSALYFLFASTMCAGDLAVMVRDQNGKPVRDAVVCALPATGQAPQRKGRAEVEQRNKQFIPYVSAVQAGGLVQFPNKDDVKHHIYSFSPAKKFELPLYSGTPPAPIAFDQPGLVTLGCNIHDWMIAYILVVPTPWFGISGSGGEAQIRGLPPGAYDIEAWQPRLKNQSARSRQRITLKGSSQLNFELDLKPDFRARRSPTDSGEGYR